MVENNKTQGRLLTMEELAREFQGFIAAYHGGIIPTIQRQPRWNRQIESWFQKAAGLVGREAQ